MMQTIRFSAKNLYPFELKRRSGDRFLRFPMAHEQQVCWREAFAHAVHYGNANGTCATTLEISARADGIHGTEMVNCFPCPSLPRLTSNEPEFE